MASIVNHVPLRRGPGTGWKDGPLRPGEKRPEGTLSSKEVCALVGISYRQLDYWIRRDYIVGQGEQGAGTIRAWTPSRVARVQEICEAIDKAKAILVAAGLSPDLHSKAQVFRGRR